jgi:acyl-CoA dehydrogenase
MLIVAWLLAIVVAFFALAYLKAAGWLWTVAIVAALAAPWIGQWISPLALLIVAAVLLLPAIVLNIPALRRKVVSDAVLSAFGDIAPDVGTERDAIEAGTVWWDGELFRQPHEIAGHAAPAP